MKKILLFIYIIVNTLFLSYSANEVPADTSGVRKNAKWKQFFSLKDSDTIRELHKITTAQDYSPLSANKWGLSLSGFICNDFFWDTRKMVDARDGAICLYPDDINADVNGRDINAHPSFNFVVMNTRLTLRIQAPDALRARVSGMIEGWFMGISNQDMNGFAMRHAFIKLDWKSTSLLLGQTWHPMFTERCFPHTVAASAGAPFQPFARSPQIRLNQRFAKYSGFLFYLNAQRDYLSTGRNGASSEYLRNSAIPETGLQYIFDYKKNKDENNSHEIYAGIGINYKYLIPRLTTAGNEYTRNGLHSGSALAFLHYNHRISAEHKWGFKVKATWSQACNEYLLPGGYAVKYYADEPFNDSINYQYTALNNFSSWLDIYAGIRSWEIGLFAGYSKNFGSFDILQAPGNGQVFFGRGLNIDYLYRISARVKYNANKLQFGLEPEYTAVRYGEHFTEKGKVMPEGSRLVHGIRILLSVTLFF